MLIFFCFKQKTAYEVRISDWSSDVCASDLPALGMMLARLFQKRCAFMGDEKIVHVGGVILLVGEDVLEHDARRGIVVAEIADQLLIMFDHQAFGDQKIGRAHV